MSKKSNKDSNTDFFLNFITKEKEEKKSENNKSSHPQIGVDYLSTKKKAYTFIIKVINLFNSTLDKMLQSSLSIKILSFMLAVLLLFTVSGGSFDSLLSSPNSGDYIDEVPVLTEGLQDDYDVVGLPKNVSVGLVGSSLDIYSTKLSKDYQVYADFSGLGEGEQTVELKTRNFPSSLRVWIVPQAVNVRITQKVTKTFDLGYKFIHEDRMDKKYSVSVDKLEHNKVEIRGTQDNIDKIHSVDALIDLSGIKDSFQQNSTISAYDRSGKKLKVEIIPNTCKVDCTVSSYSKTVDIVPEYQGATASGYGVEKVTLSKSKVKIYGNKSILKSIHSVKALIDIDQLSANETIKDVKLINQEGINRMDFDTVDCDVSIKTAVLREFKDLNIEVENNTQQYEVKFTDNSKVSLSVEGVDSVVNKMNNDDIRAYIDIKDLKAGRHDVDITIKLKNGSLKYKLLTSATVTVTLKK